MSMNTQRTSGGSVTEGLPTGWIVFDPNGNPYGTFPTALQASEYAEKKWPISLCEVQALWPVEASAASDHQSDGSRETRR